MSWIKAWKDSLNFLARALVIGPQRTSGLLLVVDLGGAWSATGPSSFTQLHAIAKLFTSKSFQLKTSEMVYEDEKSLEERMIFFQINTMRCHAPYKNPKLWETPYILQSHLIETSVCITWNRNQLMKLPCPIAKRSMPKLGHAVIAFVQWARTIWI